MPGLRPGAGTAPGLGSVPRPRFDGSLSQDAADLAAAAADFGNVVHRTPSAVLRPRSAADVQRAVRFGLRAGVPVVARGSGHGVDGQSLCDNGIVVDLSSLTEVGEPGPDEVDVTAGAPWAAVVDATLPAGRVPPVLPDLLDLSVGGTVSVGGIGGGTHQHGCIADTVRELDVVTPDGELVRCSPDRWAEVFDAVRGTQGAHGIIVRARVALRRAPRTVRRHLLGYRDLAAFLHDQLVLVGDRRFDHVCGQGLLTDADDLRFVLEAVTEDPAGPAPIDDLHHDPRLSSTATVPYRDFLRRLAPVRAQLVATGSWQHHAHPRTTVLLPGDQRGRDLLARTLAGLTPELLGSEHGGNVLLYLFPTARLAAPRVPKPQDPITIVFGVQRTAVPGSPVLAEVVRANAALRAQALLVGGAVYGAPSTT